MNLENRCLLYMLGIHYIFTCILISIGTDKWSWNKWKPQWLNVVITIKSMQNIQYTFKGIWHTFKRDNSVKFVFTPFWKGVHSKRKEFAPRGSKFFPFRVDFFSKRGWIGGKQAGSHKCGLACFEIAKKKKKKKKKKKICCIQSP